MFYDYYHSVLCTRAIRKANVKTMMMWDKKAGLFVHRMRSQRHRCYRNEHGREYAKFRASVHLDSYFTANSNRRIVQRTPTSSMYYRDKPFSNESSTFTQRGAYFRFDGEWELLVIVGVEVREPCCVLTYWDFGYHWKPPVDALPSQKYKPVFLLEPRQETCDIRSARTSQIYRAQIK